MSYLICKKCDGYYKLKEEENPEDFECCECNGELKYVQNLHACFDEELDHINEVNICPECGIENLVHNKHCLSCGKTMDNIKNSEAIPDAKEDETLKEPKNLKVLIIRATAIIIGILIVLIPSFLFVNHDYSLILLIIGGFITSFVASGKNEDGALNGATIGLIAGFILLIFKGNFRFSYNIAYNIEIITNEMIGILILFVLFSTIGGIIGAFARNHLLKINK